MQIQPISLLNLNGVATTEKATASTPSFEGVLGQALQSLSNLQNSADAQAANLAAGKNVNLVDSVLAMEQTSLSFKLAMQVRDKVVEAYQDVMRTQF